MASSQTFIPQISFLIFFVLTLPSCTPIETSERITLPTPSPSLAWWTPAQGLRYQIQFVDYPLDLKVEADIFEVDLFETPAETVEALHGMGRRVVCYVNAGAWEAFRPDAGDFPQEVIGRDYTGWPGEKWLDISRYEIFSDLMEKRFDLAVEKGCEAVETDNVQGYRHSTGFSISYGDQLAFNQWLSEQAHKRGLAIGLKNDPEQVNELLPFFDFAVVEDCAVHGECGMYLPFIQQGKAVFQIEYTDQFKSASQFCLQTQANKFSGLLKNRWLDAIVYFCD